MFMVSDTKYMFNNIILLIILNIPYGKKAACG